jgi:ABC-type dipeptide/oligopeptide/nickel transport system ATPase component
MIINIAGTNGSGKSTVVRGLMAATRQLRTIESDVNLVDKGQVKTRRMTVAQEVQLLEPATQNIIVLGRYSEGIDTGGCDTIKNVEVHYRTIYQWAPTHHVVYEGSMVMTHEKGILLVRSGVAPVHVIHLQTTLEQCQAAINERRARRGDPPFTGSWEHVEGSIVRARNFAHKLGQLGAKVHRCTRDEALPCLLGLLS